MNELFNTLNATRFELFCAKYLGSKKTESRLEGIATISSWRGKDYLLDYDKGF